MVEEIELNGNGNLVCLARGQTLQKLSKGLIDLLDLEIKRKQAGDGCPRRWCQVASGLEVWQMVGV
jgi:hypothetical protein